MKGEFSFNVGEHKIINGKSKYDVVLRLNLNKTEALKLIRNIAHALTVGNDDVEAVVCGSLMREGKL